ITAKLAALLAFSLVVAAATNAPAVIIYGFLSPPPWEPAGMVLRVLVSLIVVTTAAHLFVFWGAVALQGAVQVIFRGRMLARASETAQWLLAFVSLLLFLVLLLLA